MEEGTSVTEPEFRYFSSLPRELRDQIWQLCLPRRVLDYCPLHDPPLPTIQGISFGAGLETTCLCRRPYPTKYNNRFPVLSLVCSESRQVVQRYLELEIDNEPSIWLSKRLCSAVIFRYETDPEIYVSLQPKGSPHRTEYIEKMRNMFQWARAYNMTPCFYDEFLCFYSDLWLRHMPIAGLLQTEVIHEFVTLGSGMRLPYILVTPTLHVQEDVARRSGLFGVLGDEACQLVPITDFNRIRRFYRLSKTAIVHKGKAALGKKLFWGNILSEGRFHQYLQMHMNDLEHIMLAARWSAGTHPDDPLLQVAFSTYKPGYIPNTDVMAYRNHPWTIEARDRLPVLVPHICFRYCGDKPCLRETMVPMPKFQKRPESRDSEKDLLMARHHYPFRGQGRFRWIRWRKKDALPTTPRRVRASVLSFMLSGA